MQCVEPHISTTRPATRRVSFSEATGSHGVRRALGCSIARVIVFVCVQPSRVACLERPAYLMMPVRSCFNTSGCPSGCCASSSLLCHSSLFAVLFFSVHYWRVWPTCAEEKSDTLKTLVGRKKCQALHGWATVVCTKKELLDLHQAATTRSTILT